MIFLDETQRSYLKQLLKKNPSDWWAHKKLLEQVENEDREIEERKTCSHVYGVYEGRKVCCGKCDVQGIGMGISWTLNNKLTEEEITALRQSVEIPDPII